jgi:hypothetical protein
MPTSEKQGGFMKHPLFSILLTLVLAASSASTARADICSNATLKRAYAFTIHGQILAGPAARVLDGIALTTFDGNGKLTPVDAVSENVLWARCGSPRPEAILLILIARGQ